MNDKSSSVPCVVLEGCGNGYVFVREMERLVNLQALARDASKTFGTDGIVVVGDPTDEQRADARMRIFNKDGSEAKMCGNALRCFPLFLRKSNVTIETLSGIRKVVVRHNNKVQTIEVDMGQVRRKCITKLKNKFHVVLVDVGNPHCVIFLEDNRTAVSSSLRDVDVKTIGEKVQSFFKDSINVSFVEIVSNTEFKQRTFERGSGETLACGTAACACCVAMFETGRIKTKQRLLSHLPGGILGITWTGKMDDSIILDGPTKEVSRGRLNISERCVFEHRKKFQLYGKSYERLSLGHLETPIHAWNLDELKNEDVNIFIKRDDMTGSGLAGNKVRKLEFLLADALRRGYDCVVTAGAVQSNHCRATAVAASRCNLGSYLVLRYDDTTMKTKPAPSFTGNLLLNRLSGAHISLISQSSYERKGGGNKCVQELCERLRKMGRKPYAIPVGGSNALGTLGYVSAICEEIEKDQFDAIFVACGSGGTAAGVALGNYYSQNQDHTDVIAFGVCDSPDVFYDEIDHDMYAHLSGVSVKSRDILLIEDAQGLGYGISSKEELEFIASVSRKTGVTLDPSYSAKAALAMTKFLKKNKGKYRRVLFIHTGGLLGLYKHGCLCHFEDDEVVLGGSWSEF